MGGGRLRKRRGSFEESGGAAGPNERGGPEGTLKKLESHIGVVGRKSSGSERE